MKPSILDPRTKLVLAFTAAVILVSLDQWPFLLVAAGVIWGVTLPLNLVTSWFKFFRGLGPAVFGFFAIAWLAFDLPMALMAGSAFAGPGHGVLPFFSNHLSQRPLQRPGPDGSALRLQLCADRFDGIHPGPDPQGGQHPGCPTGAGYSAGRWAGGASATCRPYWARC